MSEEVVDMMDRRCNGDTLPLPHNRVDKSFSEALDLTHGNGWGLGRRRRSMAKTSRTLFTSSATNSARPRSLYLPHLASARALSCFKLRQRALCLASSCCSYRVP
eukprot:252879-Rhodomonas_salina.2